MTPPDSRQTIDSGIATGAALTQSSNPRYHCNLSVSPTSMPAASELWANDLTQVQLRSKSRDCRQVYGVLHHSTYIGLCGRKNSYQSLRYKNIRKCRARKAVPL